MIVVFNRLIIIKQDHINRTLMKHNSNEGEIQTKKIIATQIFEIIVDEKHT